MIDKVQNVFYRVSNMDRAAAFYGETLGLLLKFRDADKWAEYDAAGVSLGLELAEGRGSPGPGGATVVLRGPDLEGVLARVRQGGGSQIGGIEQRPYGRIARFTDPDGNEVNYLEPAKK